MSTIQEGFAVVSRMYFEHFWNDFAADKTRSLPEADRQAYTTAYSRPGRMRAAWAYFVSFQQAARDFARLSQTKLTMPVLSIGGEKANGAALAQQVQLVATNARSVTAEHRPLGDGGEPAGDDGRARRVSPSILGDNDRFVSERSADVAGIEVHAPADAIDTR